MPFLAPALLAIGAAVQTAAVAAGVAVSGAVFAVTGSGALALAASTAAEAVVPALIEGGALAGLSALISPHPAVNTQGSPQDFKPNPNAGLPVVMGRYGVGGNLVYETTSGGGNSTAAGAKGNEYLTSFVILSALGPVQAFETLRFNDTILTFDPNGQACNGGYIPEDEIQAWNPGYRHQNPDGSYINNNYQDRAWQNIQLGALNAGYFSPPDKLASDNAGLPEWTQAHGFSSYCASALTLVYDQRYYAGGVPQYQWVLQGIKIYDPRQDSTYPGGSGPQLWAGQGASASAITAARATWTFNQNPWIHALNFALGHFLPDAQTGPGRLYAGIGAGITGVDIPAFVRAANIADANGWLICGQWTTSDGKWSVLTEMAKAGSGSIVIKNGVISCIVDTPLTSLGTVTADDLSGPITLPTGTTLTSRLNTIFPRFTSEAHRWQMVQADTPVKAATYVTEDGAVRSKIVDWQYVPAVNQVCQCAAYTITNGREIPGIVLPGKPKLRNYDVGDCFTLDIPEAGLATTKVMVTKRVTDWSTGAVTLTVRTETDAKHAYSLGVSGVAPATPGISGYDPTILEAPLPASWATGLLEASDSVTGESRSIIQIIGSASDNIYAKFVDIRWRPVAEVNSVWTPTGDGSWSYTQESALQGQYPLDLNPGSYDVQIAYTTVSGAYPAADEDWLDLGVETVGGSTASNTANVGKYTTAQLEAYFDSPAADTAAPTMLAVPTVASAINVAADGTVTATLTATDSDPYDQNIAGFQFGFTLGSAAEQIFATAATNTTSTPTGSFAWSVPPGTSYSIRARAVKYSGASGQWSAPATGTAAVATTPPGLPSSLTATPGLGSNFLKWANPSNSDLDHVEVWAGPNTTAPGAAGSSAVQVGTVAAAPGITSSYVDSNVTIGTAVFYFIRSVNTSGLKSAFTSPAVSATPLGLNTSSLIGTVTSSQIQGVIASQISGTLAAVNIPGIDASKLISGALPSVVSVPAVNLTGAIASSNITAVNASAILAGALPSGVTIPAAGVSGTLTSSQIGSVLASVVSGQLSASTIPGIDTSKVISGQFGQAFLAAGAVGTSQIAAGSVISSSIAAGTIVAANIAAGAITGTLIAANTIVGANMVAGTLTAAQIAAGTITATQMNIGVSGNLIPNPNSETQGLPGAAGNGVLSYSGAYNGSYVRTLSNPSTGAVTLNLVDSLIPCAPGDVFLLTAYAASLASSAHGAITGVFYNGAGQQVAPSVQTTPAGAAAYVTSNAWTLVGNQITAPAGAVSLLPYLIANVAQGQVVFDCLFCSKMTTGSLIVNGAITATNIAAGTINGGNIAAGTITAGNIAANTITSGQIAAGTIVAANIAAGAIGTAQLAAGAVTAGSIAAGAITANALSIGQFSNNLLVNGAFATGDGSGWNDPYAQASGYPAAFGPYGTSTCVTLRAGAGSGFYSNAFQLIPGATYLCSVTYGGASASGYSGAYFRIESQGAKPSASYVNSSTSTDIVAAGAISTAWTTSTGIFTAPTSAGWASVVLYNTSGSTTCSFTNVSIVQQLQGVNLANGAVTASQIAASTITGGNIAAGTITATNIQAGTITGTLIAGNTITGNNIVGASITAASIASGTITSTQIAANTITAGNLNVSTLSAISANIGSVTAGLISNGGNTYFDLTNGRSQWLNASGNVTRLGNIANGINFWVGNPSTGIGSESTTNGIVAISNNAIFFQGSAYLNGSTLTTSGTSNSRISGSGSYALSYNQGKEIIGIGFATTKTSGYVDVVIAMQSNTGANNPIGGGLNNCSGTYSIITPYVTLASGTWSAQFTQDATTFTIYDTYGNPNDTTADLGSFPVPSNGGIGPMGLVMTVTGPQSSSTCNTAATMTVTYAPQG